MRAHLGNVALGVVSLLVTLAALEIAVRLHAGALVSTRHLVLAAQNREAVAHAEHHPLLGWIPRPGYRGKGSDRRWHYEGSNRPGTHADATVTILEDGIRSNGREPPLLPRRIVAAGDSFTFGDNVSDADSWPAHLERTLGVGVANGGVFGYGLDQSVLRAEQLVTLYGSKRLILSFIRSDVYRTMTTMRGTAAKPFFAIENGALALRNVPVPEPLTELDAFRRLFGYSYLADFVMTRAAPQYWLEGPVKRVRGDPHAISCLLVQRLARLDARVLVVGQQSRANEFDHHEVDRVLGCARASGSDTLTLFPAFARLAAAEPERYAGFFEGHLTPEGNAFVAGEIARWIRRTGWLQEAPDDRAGELRGGPATPRGASTEPPRGAARHSQTR
jgi:hypothetical protein